MNSIENSWANAMDNSENLTEPELQIIIQKSADIEPNQPEGESNIDASKTNYLPANARPAKTNLKTNTPGKPKYCAIHGTTGHNTGECHSKTTQRKPFITTYHKDPAPVKLCLIHGLGNHNTNQCRQAISIITRGSSRPTKLLQDCEIHGFGHHATNQCRALRYIRRQRNQRSDTLHSSHEFSSGSSSPPSSTIEPSE